MICGRSVPVEGFVVVGEGEVAFRFVDGDRLDPSAGEDPCQGKDRQDDERARRSTAGIQALILTERRRNKKSVATAVHSVATL
jgi:hypothetical protein